MAMQGVVRSFRAALVCLEKEEEMVALSGVAPPWNSFKGSRLAVRPEGIDDWLG